MSPWWDRAQSISTAAELDAWMMILPARSRPPWIAAILQAANSPCTGPARTWFLCKTLCLCITRFLCKTALCGKDGFDAKTSVLFKPWFKFKPKYVCILLEDVRHRPVGQVLDIRSGAYRWQTQAKNGNNHRNDSKMCKTRCWARHGQSWAQHNVRKDDEDETTKIYGGKGRGFGGFKSDEAKIRAKGKA